MFIEVNALVGTGIARCMKPVTKRSFWRRWDVPSWYGLAIRRLFFLPLDVRLYSIIMALYQLKNQVKSTITFDPSNTRFPDFGTLERNVRRMRRSKKLPCEIKRHYVMSLIWTLMTPIEAPALP